MRVGGRLRIRSRCLALLIGAALAGCLAPSPDGRERPAGAADDTATATPGALLREAESTLAAGDARRARALAERAREAGASLADPTWSVAAELVVGEALLAEGDTARARERLEAARQAARSADRPDLEAAALLRLGEVERTAGDPTAAFARDRDAARLARDADRPTLVGRAAAQTLRLRARRIQTGEATLERDPIDARQGFVALATSSRSILADAEPATDRANLALHAARSVSIVLDAARSQRAERGLDADRSQQTKLARVAAELLELGLDATGEGGQDAVAAELLGERGALAERIGEPESALLFTEQALLRAARAGSDVNRVPWHVQAARLLRSTDRRDEAIRHFAEAVALLQHHGPALLAADEDAAGAALRRAEMRAVYLGYVDLLSERAAEDERPEQAQADLVRARDTLERFKAAELRDYFADECVDRYRERVAAVDQVADGTLVVYPVVLPNRLALLVSSRQGIEQRTIPVSAEELREVVERLRGLLVVRTTHRYRRPARALHDWLIGPLEDILERESIDTIVFVPDGVLRTIPLSALYDGERFLVERFAIATTPGMELTDPRSITPDDLNVLLGGLSEARQGFEALPLVEQELETIHQRLGGELLLNDAFRRSDVAERIRQRDFDLVHLATHASFDSESSTGFLLTYDGRLGLDELAETITGDRYRKKPLELLVLSACETARGSERAALGLSGIAIKAGARSAIGTLWVVNDEAAAELLLRFYEALDQPGTSRAEALRLAQRTLIEGGRFRHPAFWSPFLLLNSWL